MPKKNDKTNSPAQAELLRIRNRQDPCLDCPRHINTAQKLVASCSSICTYICQPD